MLDSYWFRDTGAVHFGAAQWAWLEARLAERHGFRVVVQSAPFTLLQKHEQLNANAAELRQSAPGPATHVRKRQKGAIEGGREIVYGTIS